MHVQGAGLVADIDPTRPGLESYGGESNNSQLRLRSVTHVSGPSSRSTSAALYGFACYLSARRSLFSQRTANCTSRSPVGRFSFSFRCSR